MNRCGGLIIAAGNSRRMGIPKIALCFPDGTPFIVKMVQILTQAKCDPIMLCLPDNASGPAFQKLLEPYPVKLYLNQKPEYQQIGSILSCLERCSDELPRLLIWPIDTPFASPMLIKQLLNVSEQNAQTGILAPQYKDQTGHPILLHHCFFHHLNEVGAAGGIRALRHRKPKYFNSLEHDSPDVLYNINSPSDYHAVFQQAPIFLPLSPYFVS